MATTLTPEELASIIVQFDTGTVMNDTDYFNMIKTSSGNTAVKITVDLFRAYLTSKIKPSVGTDGYWYIGTTKVTDSGGNGIVAKGEVPHLAKDTTGVYYYIDSETTSDGTITKHYLVYLTDFKSNLADMSDDQYTAMVNKIVSTFESDLQSTLDTKVTEANTAIKAANDAAAAANAAAAVITGITYENGYLILND